MIDSSGGSIPEALEAIWRIESPRLIAGLMGYVQDVGAAEDLAHDALVAALEKWPESGIPPKPGAWLMTTAKNRMIDQFRRRQRSQRLHQDLARDLDSRPNLGPADLNEDAIQDDLLRLMFMTCHPLLSNEARVALTLRLLGGLSTEEIARAFLVPEPTIAQRIVRAKRTLSAAKVPFEAPTGPELDERLDSVMEVMYLVFNEGYSASFGEDLIRPTLCEEALRLGRILAELLPGEAEVHGLVALMEIQASRLGTRVDANGEPILLADQNRSRWDRLLIQRGLAALDRVDRLGGTLGSCALQAAIAACHARAPTAAATDWERIVALYDALAQLNPSPVVLLNRAVAVAMAYGPAAGLELLDQLAAEPALRNYHWLPRARGDLLQRLNRNTEAAAEFRRAAELTPNRREKDLLNRWVTQVLAQ